MRNMVRNILFVLHNWLGTVLACQDDEDEHCNCLCIGYDWGVVETQDAVSEWHRP